MYWYNNFISLFKPGKNFQVTVVRLDSKSERPCDEGDKTSYRQTRKKYFQITSNKQWAPQI